MCLRREVTNKLSTVVDNTENISGFDTYQESKREILTVYYLRRSTQLTTFHQWLGVYYHAILLIKGEKISDTHSEVVVIILFKFLCKKKKKKKKKKFLCSFNYVDSSRMRCYENTHLCRRANPRVFTSVQ
jgi:hypothetical protein